MRRIETAAIALLCAASATAQAPPASVSVLVPVVGSVVGANDVRWKTDVELYNDTRGTLFIALRLPTTPDQPTIALTLPPGATQKFTDVIGEAFGLDSVLSPLIVETLGKRPVRVSASVYGIRGSDITPAEAIPIAFTESSFPLRTLSGLSFSEVFRTNVGLVNLGNTEARFTMALQRFAGRNIAVTTLTLPPNSLAHSSIQSLFPVITKGDDFSVVVETGAPNTYVYASVIENATSIARFIAPSIGAPDAQLAQRSAQ